MYSANILPDCSPHHEVLHMTDTNFGKAIERLLTSTEDAAQSSAQPGQPNSESAGSVNAQPTNNTSPQVVDGVDETTTVLLALLNSELGQMGLGDAATEPSPGESTGLVDG